VLIYGGVMGRTCEVCGEKDGEHKHPIPCPTCGDPMSDNHFHFSTGSYLLDSKKRYVSKSIQQTRTIEIEEVVATG
jgi:hypothetical protein